MKKPLVFLALSFSTLAFSQTKQIYVDFDTSIGTGRKMTGVNTGPHSIVSGTTEQCLQNIGTELVRTHDYHGPCDYYGYTEFFDYFDQEFDHSFQSHNPSGYHWESTDEKISGIVNAGLQPFFRLGISFPGGGVSPASPMPKDEDGINFRTFAGIAKRTAMHYTAGWDGGAYHTIPYWEIWNEPNNGGSWTIDSVDAYYRMYQECADSLRSFDPELKIGGPGTAKNAFFTGGIHYTIDPDYVADFLSFCQTDTVPLDFYSFHMYDRKNPYNIRILTDTLSYYLDQYGFTETELVISETNINTGGYDNTSKGCSYLLSELISTVNSRLSKFIWYRGVDLNPLCNSDIGTEPDLTLNGYAYRFFNELNDSTSILIGSSGNEFNSTNIMDSLNNVMILSGKNATNTMVKVLISNHESAYSDLNITLENLPWTSSDQLSVTIEQVTSSGHESSTSTMTGGGTMNVNISSLTDASSFLITLKQETLTSMDDLSVDDDLNLYPNPANTKTFVKTKAKEFNLRLINAQGQLLIDQNNLNEIDVTTLQNGLYMVLIKDRTGFEQTTKLMVAK